MYPESSPVRAYSSVSNTDMKASWGMLTEPMVFIRFLPFRQTAWSS